jgi:hypothetical protein
LRKTPIAPSDLIQRVGRGVLDRASVIRASLVQSKLTPAWLKEMKTAANESHKEVETEIETVAKPFVKASAHTKKRMAKQSANFNGARTVKRTLKPRPLK